MKKRCILIFLICIFIIPFILADSFNDEIKKVTYYAGEYESGNINYAQFLIYSSAASAKIDKILGSSYKSENIVTDREKLEQALGEADEYTKRVWGNNNETKVDTPLPVWNKIIFDGKKVQIKFGASPTWNSYNGNNENNKIVYRPYFSTEFKTPLADINEKTKINEIEKLISQYSNDPNDQLADEIAKKSSDLQKEFRNYLNKNSINCEEKMTDIFGIENKGETQKIIVNDFIISSNDEFEVTAMFERCDDCYNPYFNLGLNVKVFEEYNYKDMQKDERKDYEGKSVEELIDQYKTSIEDAKNYALKKDYDNALIVANKVKFISEALRMKSWDINRENNQKFKDLKENNKDIYDIIKNDLKRKSLERESQKEFYEKTKLLILNSLSGYEKNEYYYLETNYRKLLYQGTKPNAEEICSNNLDDNNDGVIDCEDPNCQGKICGNEDVETISDNITVKNSKKLYCIEKICAERKQVPIEETVCGNNKCEPEERGTCEKDCPKCEEYPAMDCNGKVIFSGFDEKNCPLKPICIEDKKTCNSDTDCPSPLCGISKCLENTCKITVLEECKIAECVEGEEKMIECINGEKIIFAKCLEGTWKNTGMECEVKNDNETINEKKPENECQIKEDCNSLNYICSNGKCIMLAMNSIEKPVEITVPEINEDNINNINNEKKETSKPTGGVIYNFFHSFLAITGYEVMVPENNNTDVEQNSSTESQDINNNQNNNQISDEQRMKEEQKNRELENKRQQQEREEQNRKDNERRNEECKNNCETHECPRIVESCIKDCVFTDSKEQDQNEGKIDECKNKCESDNKAKLEDCSKNCINSCMSGKGFQMDIKENKPDKKTSIYLAGMCRKEISTSNKKENFGDLRFEFDGDNMIQKNMEKYNKWDGGYDWAKNELDRLILERKEFEKSFNNDFAKWFFEMYLPSSLYDWEESSSGINELYNRDQKNIMEVLRAMENMKINEFPGYHLINMSYSTEYGQLYLWEEEKTIKNFKFGDGIVVVSPYMKSWIFPPKEFIRYSLKQMMNSHELPGAAKDRQTVNNGQIIPREDIEKIKTDKSFMISLKKITDKYNGDMNGVAQIKDDTNNETLFNIYVNVNANDILKIEPMPVSEVPKQDIKAVFDFEKIYDFVYFTQKEMEQDNIQRPEWDKKSGLNLNGIIDGVKIFFKVRGIINSAEVTPKSARKDITSLTKSFIKMAITNSNKEQEIILSNQTIEKKE